MVKTQISKSEADRTAIKNGNKSNKISKIEDKPRYILGSWKGKHRRRLYQKSVIRHSTSRLLKTGSLNKYKLT